MSRTKRYRVTDKQGNTKNLKLSEEGRRSMEYRGCTVEKILPTVAASYTYHPVPLTDEQIKLGVEFENKFRRVLNLPPLIPKTDEEIAALPIVSLKDFNA